MCLSFLSQPMTVMPLLTSSRQMAAPIPALAPVTRATRPAHRSMTFLTPTWGLHRGPTWGLHTEVPFDVCISAYRGPTWGLRRGPTWGLHRGPTWGLHRGPTWGLHTEIPFDGCISVYRGPTWGLRRGPTWGQYTEVPPEGSIQRSHLRAVYTGPTPTWGLYTEVDVQSRAEVSGRTRLCTLRRA